MKLYRICRTIYAALAWPFLILLLLDLFWPGDNPLWIGFVMLPVILLYFPSLVVVIVVDAVRWYRNRRTAKHAKR